MFDIFHIDAAFAGVITDAPTVMSVLMKALQFFLSVIGIFGIIGLVLSGIIFLTAGGSVERVTLAKRAAIASIVGLVFALGASRMMFEQGLFG